MYKHCMNTYCKEAGTPDEVGSYPSKINYQEHKSQPRVQSIIIDDVMIQ